MKSKRKKGLAVPTDPKELRRQLKGSTKQALLNMVAALHDQRAELDTEKHKIALELDDTRKFGDRMAKEKEQAAKNYETELEILKEGNAHREAKMNGEIAGLRDALRIVSGGNP